MSVLQPFRTTPLVTPAPKTINEVVQNRNRPGLNSPRQEMMPNSPTFGQHPHQQMKTVNIGGSQKQIVSSQFNSPLNMYSDEAIAESAMIQQAK